MSLPLIHYPSEDIELPFGRIARPPNVVMEGRDLVKCYRRPDNSVVRALDGVSLKLMEGEILAVVGASGSGKSSLGRVLARLTDVERGSLQLGDTPLLGQPLDLAQRRRVQLIFQDPFASLNPVHTVAHHIERPLLRHRLVTRGRALRQRVHALLTSVGLDPPEQLARRRPDELSGGQRQRVAIARATALDPDILIADEPTSMLDVSLRAGILNLLATLRQERRMTIIIITHDLASARYIADRVIVMHEGRIVERGPIMRILEHPEHPYTRQLMGCDRQHDRPRQR